MAALLKEPYHKSFSQIFLMMESQNHKEKKVLQQLCEIRPRVAKIVKTIGRVRKLNCTVNTLAYFRHFAVDVDKDIIYMYDINPYRPEGGSSCWVSTNSGARWIGKLMII